MERYNKLAEFKQKNGHFQVSLAEDRDLCFWLNAQRKIYRSGTLRKERQELLDKIEFVWTVKKGHFRAIPVAPALTIDLNAEPKKEVARSTAGAESATSSSIPNQIPAAMHHQTFAVGTRIEKVFKIDGVSQAFGGNVQAFEYFEDEDGAKAWGYLIHYDDGDREHMLEADVAKNMVGVKSHKRAAKSQGTQQKSKRTKQMNVPGNEVGSIAALEKKMPELDQATAIDTVVGQTDGNFFEKLPSAIQARSNKDREKPHSEAVTKKAPREKNNPRVSRLRDAKLNRLSEESLIVANSVTTKKKSRRTKRLVIHDSERDDSSVDELLHLLVRKPALSDPQLAGKDKTILPFETADLVDDNDDSCADRVPTPTLHVPSHETPNPSQKFRKGTLISRMFLDLSDNGRERSYGGNVVDYVYLTEERDWFYFVQYDDGDTEFMDEWEVAKFSATA